MEINQRKIYFIEIFLSFSPAHAKKTGTKMQIQLNHLLLLAFSMMAPNFVFPQYVAKTSAITHVSHAMVRDKSLIQLAL